MSKRILTCVTRLVTSAGLGLSLWGTACGGTGASSGFADSGVAGVGAANPGGAPGFGGEGTGAESSGGGTTGVGGNAVEDAGVPPDSPPGTPAHIESVGGNGFALLENWPGGELKVRITDATGTGVSNVDVTFSLLSGEGANITSPSNPTTATDENGIAGRVLQGAGFNASTAFGQSVFRASSSVGSVDFVAVTVHQSNIGPVGALIVLDKPESYDLGDVKAGSILPKAAKLQAVVQAGAFSGTPLPNVGLRFVDPKDHDVPAVANCVGGFALTNPSGVAECDLAVGSELGQHWIAAFGGESTIWTGIHFNVVP